ncbi:MAG: M12 family metallopeptidase [Planctomycetota bacterium]
MPLHATVLSFLMGNDFGSAMIEKSVVKIQRSKFITPCIGALIAVVATVAVQAGDSLAPATKPPAPKDVAPDDALLLIPVDERPRVQCSILRPEPSPTRAGVQTGDLWPDGIVPFEFDGSVSSQDQSRAIEAMAVIEGVTAVNFIPRTSESDYLVLRDWTSNSSFVGRVGGGQFVNIFNWSFRYIIVHELMHALGFEHEQSRSDRNSFVSINFANICCDADFNFFTAANVTDFGDYDFESVMHYDAFAFSNDCCSANDRTITVLPPNEAFQTVIGQRSYLSEGDIAGLQFLYEGSPAASPFFDDFETGSFDSALWTGVDNAIISDLGINPPSGTLSLNLAGSNQGGQQVRSGLIDTSFEQFVVVSYWWQRRGGGNSPEAGEDLVLEYRDANGEWIEFARHLGNGLDMTTFEFNEVTLMGSALHTGFRVRIRAISSNINQDDWYVDDVMIGIPISNNACQFGLRLNEGANAYNSFLASSSGATESCGDFESDVWFFYITPCDGTLNLSVCDADYDTELAVYGVLCPMTADQAIACSDDDCGAGSSVSIPVTANSFYRIRVGGKNGATGSGTLMAECMETVVPCPADCAPDNGDGTFGNGVVNVDDLIAVITSFGDPGGPCDLAPDNGDGTFGNGIVNVDDLIGAINAFGACPQ